MPDQPSTSSTSAPQTPAKQVRRGACNTPPPLRQKRKRSDHLNDDNAIIRQREELPQEKPPFQASGTAQSTPVHQIKRSRPSPPPSPAPSLNQDCERVGFGVKLFAGKKPSQSSSVVVPAKSFVFNSIR